MSSRDEGASTVRLTASPLTLRFRRTFAISRGGRDQARNVLAVIERDGVVGIGEGAPNLYYDGQTQETALAGMAEMEGHLAADPYAAEVIGEALARAFPAQSGARAAVDIALHDWIGRRLGVPVASLFGLPTGLRMSTSYTISLGSREDVVDAVEQAEGWPLLKLKLGGDDDLGLAEAALNASSAIVRVDANAAWTVDEAIEKGRALSGMGVELIEQPIPPGDPDVLRRVSGAVDAPIVADEDCRTSRDVQRLAGCVDGVNIKLAKTGGIREALNTALVARALGLNVMLGTMAESSIGTAAMAQLIPLARWVDLDGPLLLRPEDDLAKGLRYEDGQILMPEGPGIGVTLREGRPVG